MTIRVFVEGEEAAGFSVVNIERSLSSFTHSFDIDFPNVNRSKRMAPMLRCSIRDDDDLLLSGYIDTCDFRIDSSSTLLRVFGRSKSADMADCSAEVPGSGRIADERLSGILRVLLRPYGLSVRVSKDTDIIKEFTVNPGETILEAAIRVGRPRGVIPATLPSGDIELRGTSSDSVPTHEVSGSEKIVSISRRVDYSNRFSVHRAIGQSGGSSLLLGSEDALKQAAAESKDTAVLRTRRSVAISDEVLDLEGLKSRARFMRNISRGSSDIVTVQVAGSRLSSGRVINPGDRVTCDIPSARLSPKVPYMANSVEISASAKSGTFMTLMLVTPSVFDTDPALSNASSRSASESNPLLEKIRKVYEEFAGGGNDD